MTERKMPNTRPNDPDKTRTDPSREREDWEDRERQGTTGREDVTRRGGDSEWEKTGDMEEEHPKRK